jgi:hypothetical protein
MRTALDSIVAHLDGQRDPLERLTETLRSLPPEQRQKILVQFCPKCRGARDPRWWDREDCERCSRAAPP